MKFRFLITRNLFIAGGLIIAIGSSALWLSKKTHPTSATESIVKAALSVESVSTRQVDWPMTIKLNGGVFPWQEAQVSAEIGGLRIKQVLVDIGSEVKLGQALVLLADETVIADLHKQQATVDKDKANLAEAESNAERAREIKDSGALSTQKINEYLIAEQTAKANLALSLAELENQQIRLRQTRVIATDDGVISSRSANLGNVVATGTELFKLIRQNRIEWRAEVNAEQLAMIHKGQKVHIILPNQQTVEGTVRLSSPTIDTNTRNAIIYVDIPSRSVKSGVYLQGSINIGKQSATVLPQTAVILRDGRAYVFEITQQNNMTKVIQRKVITGRSLGSDIEITAGVQDNAKFVLTGGAFLNDGDHVNVIQHNEAAL